MNSRIWKISLKKLCTFVIFFLAGLSYSQSVKKMQGKVVNTNGTPLFGVTVSLEGTETGTMTKIDGSYTISSDKQYLIVKFSYIGSKTKTLPFKNGTYDVILQESVEALEVVVISTGYQKLKVNEVSGAVESVKMKDFQKRIAGGGDNIITTLEGLSASLVAASNPGQEGNKQMLIRGISTLNGNASPLIILDGFPYTGRLEDLNSYDLESATVLKDAAAASIYGASSANGVIVITSKRAKEKALRFTYNTNVQVSEKNDIDYYLNRADSKYLVDLQEDYFNELDTNRKNSYQAYFEAGRGNFYSGASNKVYYSLLENHEGRLSDAELSSTLKELRATDNMDDLKKLLLQNPLYTEHNFAVEYANQNLNMRSSLNYFKNINSIKGSEDQAVKYSMNTSLNVSNNFKLDLLARFNVGEDNSNKTSYKDLLNISSYENIWDANGNPLAITKGRSKDGRLYGGKDIFEIERLKGLGMFDETYKPAMDFGMSSRKSNNWGARFQAQATLKITNDLKVNGGFNISKQSNTKRLITDGSSWHMRALLNNTTLETPTEEKGELLLPLGDMIREDKSESTDYLLRGQLQYDKTFNEKHKVLGLLGSEIRGTKNTGTSIERFGYDKRSNTFNKLMDYNRISKIKKGVFHPSEQYSNYELNFVDNFMEAENRYFSLYGNATYIYDNRYIVHGSVRLDQSNLFGTDPKYRYRPFWSGSFKWRVGNEEFFKNDIVNSLDLQVSYGTNGNISNDSGPFDIGRYIPINPYNSVPNIQLYSPKINDLRWETTKSFNLGLRANMVNRIDLTLDLYRKRTRDAFAQANIDPTLGFATLKRNDATLLNEGIEVSVNSVNVQTKNFTWSTNIGVNYNKSIVEEVAIDRTDDAYTSLGRVTNKKGYSPNSLFVTEWGGINDKGQPMLKGKGDKIMTIKPGKYTPTWEWIPGFSTTDIEFEDLTYAGTTVPNLVARMTNNLSYKNLDLSFLFVYQGGQSMIKDSYYGDRVTTSVGNVNKDVVHAWKEAGDEKKPNVLPKVGSDTGYNSKILKFSDKNILDGDFIRLRDVVLSYRIPKSAFVTAKSVKNVVFNIKAKNMYLWTKNKEGIDPEAHGLGFRYLPTNKSFSIGVNVTF